MLRSSHPFPIYRPLRLPVGVGFVHKSMVLYDNIGYEQLTFSVTWDLAGDSACLQRPGLGERMVQTLCVYNSTPTGSIQNNRTFGSNYLASRSGVVSFLYFFGGGINKNTVHEHWQWSELDQRSCILSACLHLR